MITKTRYKAILGYFAISDVVDELEVSKEEAYKVHSDMTAAADSLEYLAESLKGTSKLAKNADKDMAKEIEKIYADAHNIAAGARQFEKDVDELYKRIKKLVT
jgi:polyhydroxyalkanoate synthesis regulator phasin